MPSFIGPENLNNLVEDACLTFLHKFKEEPAVVVCAPGRVNLIGEHVDYSEGCVLPLAIPLYTVMVGKCNNTKQCLIRSCSQTEDPEVVIDLTQPLSKDTKSPWANYIRGVIHLFKQANTGFEEGFNAVLTSDIPMGGGLSSSAALEVTTCLMLECLASSPTILSKREKAFLCQKAEHDFAGVPCGIMDQYIILMAEAGHALLLDCRSMTAELVPLSETAVAVLVINSNAHHQLTGSEYPERRQLCDEAAKLLEKSSLRDLSRKEFEEVQPKLPPVMCRRVRHVVTEIERTWQAVEALRKHDYEKVGQLMQDSHKSLRDDFEVSCYELDALVDLANAHEGVYGSRMTGAGFGGCTVTLLKKDVVPALIKHVQDNFWGKPTFYTVTPVDGARVLRTMPK